MLHKMDEYARAAILLSVRSGTISRAAAFERYIISEDEFALWERAFDDEGIVGLRDRRLSARRRREPSAALTFEA